MISLSPTLVKYVINNANSSVATDVVDKLHLRLDTSVMSSIGPTSEIPAKNASGALGVGLLL